MAHPQPMPLAFIPNQDGYEFIGVRKDGSRARCYVWRDPRTDLHYVAGEAEYSDLIGWYLDASN